MVFDNDLSVLGYVSDYICCLYGLRGAYGVVCVTQDSEVFARRGLQGIVGELLDRKDETCMKAEICSELGLNQILERNMVHLSSGEFQSFLPYLKNSGSQRRDTGKSTIRGQILFLSGQVDERTIQKYEREAKDMNRESWPKGTGHYDKFYDDGVYNYGGCGTPVYKSTTKFSSGCG